MEDHKSPGTSFSQTRRPALVLAAVCLAWALAIVLCYHNTTITFLRAESGWFHFLSHTAAPPHYGLMQIFFSHSYHGHYTPLAFCTEIEVSYFFGPHEAVWKFRQLAALTLLAVALSFLAYNIARTWAIPRWNAVAISGGFTAVFVFQPLMRELVASPFLVLQIMAGTFSALTLLALMQWMKNPGVPQWIWLTAMLAYLSMHFIGYGIANVGATAVMFCICLAGISSGRLPQFLTVR